MNTYAKISGFADEITQDLQTQIDNLKKLNMHYVEMRGVDGNNLIYHNDNKVEDIKARLDDAGIALSALGSPLGKIGITDPFEKHLEEFKRAVEIAHMMNAQNIRMFSFYVPENFREDPSIKEEVWKRMEQFVEYAKKENVVLLHENEKGIYGEMAKECKELMDDFGCDHFKAIFDFANFIQAKQNTLEAYDILKDHIAYIHVKDALWETGKVVPAGYGDGNLEEILGHLFKGGFEGFLSLEPHLFDFDGFAGLEKDTKELPAFEEGKKLTGEEAFTLAHGALSTLLARIV